MLFMFLPTLIPRKRQEDNDGDYDSHRGGPGYCDADDSTRIIMAEPSAYIAQEKRTHLLFTTTALETFRNRMPMLNMHETVESHSQREALDGPFMFHAGYDMI
jgi:hypothetical protein